NGHNIKNKIQITDEMMVKMKKVLSIQKDLPFPKGEIPTYYRGRDNLLNEVEMAQFFDSINMPYRFTREHPEYKNDKAKYPFLNKINISEDDLVNIRSPLFTNLVKNIQVAHLGRDIEVKGYTGLLHVDTKSNKMIVADVKVYKRGHDLFSSSGSSIHHQHL